MFAFAHVFSALIATAVAQLGTPLTFDYKDVIPCEDHTSCYPASQPLLTYRQNAADIVFGSSGCMCDKAGGGAPLCRIYAEMPNVGKGWFNCIECNGRVCNDEQYAMLATAEVLPVSGSRIVEGSGEPVQPPEIPEPEPIAPTEPPAPVLPPEVPEPLPPTDPPIPGMRE